MMSPEFFPLAQEATDIAACRVLAVYQDKAASIDERNIEAARLWLASQYVVDTSEGALEQETVIFEALQKAGASEADARGDAHTLATNKRCQIGLTKTLGRHASDIKGIIPPENYDFQEGWSPMHWAFLNGLIELGERRPTA